MLDDAANGARPGAARLAGAAWPSADLTAALARAEGVPDAALRAKIRPVAAPS
jgi:hypothetical protein